MIFPGSNHYCFILVLKSRYDIILIYVINIYKVEIIKKAHKYIILYSIFSIRFIYTYVNYNYLLKNVHIIYNLYLNNNIMLKKDFVINFYKWASKTQYLFLI